MTDPAVVAFAALFGLVIGSFLNVCISRWPEKLSVVRPRSRCPNCGHEITWHENIPVLSWLFLRGKCSGCGQRISPLYPAIELAVALLWAASFAAFGPTLDALRIAIFSTVLLGVAATDALHYVIPDGFTVFGLVWNLATSLLAFALASDSIFASPYQALLGACVGAGAIAIVGWLGEVILKKEAMGFGDITLMAMVGAALGPNFALLTIFVGALIGAVVFLAVVYPIAWWRSRARHEAFAPPLVPFGVFLAPAAVATLVWGNDLLAWYQRVAMGA
jgi:leader peptidase (prepilin peptidase) / N-methyltransferase